jgi:hypothetical protein
MNHCICSTNSRTCAGYRRGKIHTFGLQLKNMKLKTSAIFFLLLITFEYIQATPGFRSDTIDSAFLARKVVEAVRISLPPKIDGKLDEPFWQQLPVAGHFVQYSPLNGALPVFPTEIYFAYDDVALYVGAVMYDPAPDSICRQMGRRDQIEQLNTDYISIDILPYNDALNMYEFKISPENLQNDCKYSAIGQDIFWDAVWETATSITANAWIAEVKIPYSALRFPKQEKQVWGINMWRNNQRRREYSTWCFVDIANSEIFKYYGEVTGMQNITPPLRLSFTPYVATYVEQEPGTDKWNWFARGGMDLKYGISESYTLDMVLIPDFGQVQADDKILNLSPFEIRYDEKRQFFTEGTELFDKCDIFYSRRVGGAPKGYNLPYSEAQEGEVVTSNPDETRMINATKISGRNSNGLGLGFFNAMTINTWAELKDTVTGHTRRILTQPFTNYNVMVVDQSLKNSSYFTLINTNYYTPDSKYCANVTGTEMKFSNKKNTFAAFGRLNVSQIYQEGSEPYLGTSYEVSVGKPSGIFTCELSRSEISKSYDINDMGFIPYNNDVENHLSLTYNIYKPVWKIMNSRTEWNNIYKTLSSPASYTLFETELSNVTTFRNYWSTVLVAGWDPFGFDDYYEPRTWGWVYKRPPGYYFQGMVQTDIRRKFRMTISAIISNIPENNNFGYNVTMTPGFRFSDKFNVSLSLGYNQALNEYGYVFTQYDSLNDPTIYFGRRDVPTFNNILTMQYIFNTKMSLSLRARHYWSRALYYDFYTLTEEGNLDPSDYEGNQDLNFNAFTADLQFTWYFAPGSEMSVMWKNAINTLDNDPVNSYAINLDNMFSSPQSNSFSIRVLYYLDYLYLKKAFTRRSGKRNVHDN